MLREGVSVRRIKNKNGLPDAIPAGRFLRLSAFHLVPAFSFLPGKGVSVSAKR
jgi:hypothetical protein